MSNVRTQSWSDPAREGAVAVRGRSPDQFGLSRLKEGERVCGGGGQFGKEPLWDFNRFSPFCRLGRWEKLLLKAPEAQLGDPYYGSNTRPLITSEQLTRRVPRVSEFVLPAKRRAICGGFAGRQKVVGISPDLLVCNC